MDVDVSGLPGAAALGDSVCVSGCCLTVAGEASGEGERRRGTAAFDVVPETLSKTTLGRLRVGSRVNLEGSVTPTTLLGGHLVQGHVDGVGQVLRVEKDAEWRVRIGAADGLMEYVSPKGSVAVDGVSLTIAAIGRVAGGGGGWFEVALIPTTLAKTTLSNLREGDACNLEMDMIAKMVVHWLQNYGDRG
jgi:riboflavin synthase